MDEHGRHEPDGVDRRSGRIASHGPEGSEVREWQARLRLSAAHLAAQAAVEPAALYSAQMAWRRFLAAWDPPA